jgi:hypothetical protein
VSLDTYAGLKQAVADWLNRDDLATQIPDFIRLGEADLRRKVRPLSTIARAYTTLDEDYENLPSDFLEPVSIHLDTTTGRRTLQYCTPAQIAAMRCDQGTGAPRAYTVIGNQFWFDRTPSSNQAEIAYYAVLPHLSDTVPTTALLTEQPNLYLYSALTASAPYLKDDDRVAVWKTLYESAAAEYKVMQDRAKYGSSPLTMRTTRGFC